MMKVKIYKDPAFGTLVITFYEESGSGNKLYVAKPIVLELEEYDESKNYEPTLKIPWHGAQGLLQSMAVELSNLGINIDKVKETQSALEATKIHLQDMRNLVFNKKSLIKEDEEVE